MRLTELGNNKLRVARSDLGVLRDKMSQSFTPAEVTLLNAFVQTMQNKMK